MLAIRMQRTGRKNHTQFRVVVQDSRFSPTSGRVVANLGTYDPHTKVVKIDSVKANEYLANGAQPSGRVISVLVKNGMKMPDWVAVDAPQSKVIRHSDKLRRNQPKAEVVTKEDPAAVVEEAPVATEVVEVSKAEETPAVKAEVTAEAPVEA